MGLLTRSPKFETGNILVILVLTLCIGICWCKNCEVQDRCSCIFDDNSGMIDIWSVARTDGNPLFLDSTASGDSYMYSYNPCYGFSEGACSSVSVCQYDYQYYGFYEIGAVEGVEFSYDGLNVIATYKSLDGVRTTYVTLVCDPTATDPRLDVQGETVPLEYYMTLTTAAACPVPAPGSLGGLSAGSVLLIIFFVLIFVYIAAGITFNKVKVGKTGRDVMPNIEFWALLPGLIKEGCAFAMGKVCGCRRSVYVKM